MSSSPTPSLHESGPTSPLTSASGEQADPTLMDTSPGDSGEFRVIDFNTAQDSEDVDVSSETQDFSLVEVVTENLTEGFIPPSASALTTECHAKAIISMPSPGKDLPKLQVSDIVSLDTHNGDLDSEAIALADSLHEEQSRKSFPPPVSPIQSPVLETVATSLFKSSRSFTDAEIVSQAMFNYKHRLQSVNKTLHEVLKPKKVDISNNIPPQVLKPKKVHTSELTPKNTPSITMIIHSVEKAKPKTCAEPMYLEMKLQDKVLTPRQGTLGGDFASTNLVDLKQKPSANHPPGERVFKLTKKGLVDKCTQCKSMIKERIQKMTMENDGCEIIEDSLGSVLKSG